MRSLKKKESIKKGLIKALLILCYFPLSCGLIGLLAYHMRYPSPVEGSYPFVDVFKHYANPFNSAFASMHIPTLIFSLAFLIFMATLIDTTKPVITLSQIRVLLLTLIAIVTIFVYTFIISSPFHYREPAFMHLFLYVDVDLILLYLLTYLPYFRKLKTKHYRQIKSQI